MKKSFQCLIEIGTISPVHNPKSTTFFKIPYSPSKKKVTGSTETVTTNTKKKDFSKSTAKDVFSFNSNKSLSSRILIFHVIRLMQPHIGIYPNAKGSLATVLHNNIPTDFNWYTLFTSKDLEDKELFECLIEHWNIASKTVALFYHAHSHTHTHTAMGLKLNWKQYTTFVGCPSYYAISLLLFKMKICFFIMVNLILTYKLSSCHQ